MGRVGKGTECPRDWKQAREGTGKRFMRDRIPARWKVEQVGSGMGAMASYRMGTGSRYW